MYFLHLTRRREALPMSLSAVVSREHILSGMQKLFSPVGLYKKKCSRSVTRNCLRFCRISHALLQKLPISNKMFLLSTRRYGPQRKRPVVVILLYASPHVVHASNKASINSILFHYHCQESLLECSLGKRLQ